MRSAVTAVEDAEGAVGVLINNAGYSQSGAVESVPDERVRAQFDTNVFGLLGMCRAVLPKMREAGWGKIVNVSSMGGRFTFPGGGIYHASKHAVEALSDALRFEVEAFGVDVVIIEPGPIESRFRANAIDHIGSIDIAGSVHRASYERDLARRKEAQPGDRFRLGPEAVLKALVHAVESPRPKARYPVTTPTRVAAFLKRILPTQAMDRIVGRVRR
jgi:NAD(P)-dependent dehydrogenase (short-subunit alcohol dehydrogenase family)